MAEQFLGQIFYGRAPDGYGVLGSSPAGRPFIGALAALCRTVGSPDRPGDVRPFLLSKREGTAVLMIQACRGPADPTGRATIFFHALVADAASLQAAGLDAFSLAKAGVFAESCPSRELSDLPFPSVKQHQVAPVEVRRIDLPATISAERPLDELVRQELGAKSLDLNWATFTFNPLSDFDLCVLSFYSPRKGTGTQYAFDNAGLHRLSPVSVTRRIGGEENSSAGRSSMQKSSLFLLLSLVANAILVLTIFLQGGGADGVKAKGKEMTESDAREKWEAKWKSEWEKILPQTSSAMTEAEAKAKWAAQWKLEWEKSLPPMPSAMTEVEAREKWEMSWRKEWTQTLRMDFEKAIRDSGGEWPIHFDNANSPFLPIVRSAETEPEEEKLAQKWRIYRSCKTCSEFIQKYFNH